MVEGLNIFHYAFLKPANSFAVQDDKAHKATQSGPKLEIKVDAEGTAALVTVPDEEHSKSCNLSPLTPKCAPCHHRMALEPGLKSGRMQEYHIRNDENSPVHGSEKVCDRLACCKLSPYICHDSGCRKCLSHAK